MANDLLLMGVGPSGAGEAAISIDFTKALNYDRIDNYMLSGTSIFADLTSTNQAFTFFCRLETVPFAQSMYIVNPQGVFAGAPLLVWLSPSNDNVIAYVYGSAGGFRRNFSTTNSVPSSGKFSLAVVWPGAGAASAFPNIYINGVDVSGTNGTSGTLGSTFDDTTTVTQFGVRETTSITNEYEGKMCDVAFWLSDQAANLSAIDNGGTRHNLMDLASPPDFYVPSGGVAGDDATSGTGVMQDVSGNANNCTPYNTVAGDIVTW